MKRRRSYTKEEAVQTMGDWLWKNRMSQEGFRHWLLEEHNILISQPYLASMLSGKKLPGPRFREAFTAITGVKLSVGFVEDQQ